jgi:hypothetical protein
VVGGAAALVVVCACGEPDVKLGQNIGLTPIKGDTQTSLDPDACPDECRLWFARDIEVSSQREVASLTDYIKALDLEVEQLQFEDADTGEVLTMTGQVHDGTVTIAKSAVLTNEDLADLPRTVRLEGDAMISLRKQLVAKQTAMLNVVAELVVASPLPKNLRVRYWVQPVLVIGPQ